MVQGDRADEAELARPPREASDGHAIAEDVVNPAQIGGLGRDLDLRLQQLLVIAVARPEHDPMLAQRHGLSIAVDGRMSHGDQGHWTGISPLCCTAEEEERVSVETSATLILHRNTIDPGWPRVKPPSPDRLGALGLSDAGSG